MGFYRRNRSLFLIVLGAGLMATSLFWEYARMKPDYRYLVEPWSLRGYDTPQGWVMLALGLAIMIVAIPLSLRWLKGGVVESLVLAGVVTTFATLVPVFAKAPDQQPGAVPVWILSLLLGLAAVGLAARFIPEGWGGRWRRLLHLGIFAGVTVLAGLLVYDRLLGGRNVPAWVLVLILMASLSVLALARPPEALAPYRLLLAGVVIAWVVALVSAGALRSTLLRLQLENMGISAQYRDIQITSGVILTWVGGLLAFAGAVALWAHRRDELEERSRAGQQLAVAAASARELEEAV